MKLSTVQLALGVACVSVGSHPVAAQMLLVNWGGNYVTTNEDLNRLGSAGSNFGNLGGTATLDSRRITTFDPSTPLSPEGTASGTSGIFYGGWQVVRHDNSNSPAKGHQRITNSGTSDAITFRADLASGTGTGEAQGILLWQKADFLNLSTDTIRFDATSTLNVTFGSDTAHLSEARWVVQIGTTYYISQSTFNSSTTLESPANEQWATFDPSADLKFSGTTFSSVTMTSIEAVGIYFAGNSLTWTGPTTGGLRIDIEGFSATGTAIPEPSTYAAIAGGLMLAAAVWRRRRTRTDHP